MRVGGAIVRQVAMLTPDRAARAVVSVRLRPAGAWDSQMVGLAALLETAYGTYLFYNGNGYGATGFGVAVAEDL